MAIGREGTGACGAGGEAQAANIPTIRLIQPRRIQRAASRLVVMTLLLLEALGAFLIFLFIVWWTMFSGRRKGELPESVEEEKKKAAKSSDAEPKP